MLTTLINVCSLVCSPTAEHYLPQPEGPDGLWLDVMDPAGGQLAWLCQALWLCNALGM